MNKQFSWIAYNDARWTKLIRVSIKEIIYDYSISIENHLDKRLLLS